jgi:hypothetical protein
MLETLLRPSLAWRRSLVGGAAALLLSACGPGHPTVSIVTPVDGAVITGERTIMVSGTVSGASAVAVSVAGGAEVAATITGSTFEALVTLGDRANVITAVATGGGGASEAQARVEYPFIRLASNQDASLVIGRSSFTESPTNIASPSSLRGGYGRVHFDGQRLFVSDYGAHQVLVFDAFPTENGAAADWFIGSADGQGGTAGLGPEALGDPQTVLGHDGRLFVVEERHARVKVYDPVPSETGAAAAFVIGNEPTGACARGSFDTVVDAHIGGGRLVVSDRFLHRVVIYLDVPSAPGAEPDLVLGQADFDSCQANRGLTFDDDLDVMQEPGGVWTDGTRLAVADWGNGRVLIWESFPTENGQGADLVLGTGDTGASALDAPYFLDSNGNQLAVADSEGRRVLVWNTFPREDAQQADVVLGQSDFDERVLLAPGGTPTARNFRAPAGVAFGPDFLATTDSDAMRVLIFRDAP